MKTCKECEHYEFYDGPEETIGGLKAIMRCNSENPLIKLSGVITRCGKFFTPKKPQEIKKSCKNCINSMSNNKDGKPCNKNCDGSRYWQPIPKEKPKEPEEKSCTLCNYGNTNKSCVRNLSDECLGKNRQRPYEYNNFEPIPKPGQATISPEDYERRNRQPKLEMMGMMAQAKGPMQAAVEAQQRAAQAVQQAPPGYKYETSVPYKFNMITPKITLKQKEKTMWKKLRKRARRITIAWDLIGVYLLCRWVNPWAFKILHMVWPGYWTNGTDFEIVNPSDPKQVFMVWLAVIAAIAYIVAAIHGLNRLAAWWYGEAE